MSQVKLNRLHKFAAVLSLALIAQFASMASWASDFAAHKVVIQVSTKDPLVQKIALNNAVNLQKHYGPDNIKVEVVAYGPGLSLLTKKSSQKDRIKSLAVQDITFSACSNTMRKVKKKTGKNPALVEGVGVVPAGVARILELQEKGYSYVRP